MSSFEGLFKLSNKELKRYSVIIEGEDESGVEWLVQFYLPDSDYDDSFDEDYREEIVIVAVDFETAYKYAQQYIRTMQIKSETKELWRNAEIVSVDKR